jgi:Tol biopolymer transport system component
MSHRPTSLTLVVSALVVLAFGAAPGARQTGGASPAQSAGTASITAEARWRRALDAWAAGRYPAALEDLRTLMKSAAAAEYFERVALLTGELHVTTVLTADGRNPRISGNGGFVSYEVGPNDAATTRIVRMAAKPETVADLPTTAVAFDRGGRRLAWLKSGAGAPPAASEIVVRDLTTGTERSILGPGLLKSSLIWAGDDQSVLFVGARPDDQTRTDIYSVREGTAPVALTDQAGFKSTPVVDQRGTALVYTVPAQSPFAAGRGGGGRGGGGGGGRGGAPTAYGVLSLSAKTTRPVTGSGLTISADGSMAAWVSREGDVSSLNVMPIATGMPAVIRSGRERLEAPALSPDGKHVAYQVMTHTDWEVYVSPTSGSSGSSGSSGPPTSGLAGPAGQGGRGAAESVHRRITRDIQHDLLPRFLTESMLLVLKGEARHRRSHLYDITSGTNIRLFANNSIRTISPEYIWSASADGRFLLIQADRDGDTVSTERGVSVVDLTRKITTTDLAARLDQQLAAENDLRQRMTAAFKPVEATVRQVLARAAVNRVYEYEKTLVDFDSKHITQPGNLKAIDYLEKTYRSFGYAPELQWFVPMPLKATGGKTANVIATLKGTVNPELIYVVSSHFDSVAAGPGADDDTSGTAALLETARILKDTPLPATIVFASFTGEEAGLLGSRHFVQLARENKWHVVGALNNDMIGWAADSSQINNTIRFSNPGIRDIQHGASFLFTDIVLFDAKYYRSTDAAAFYEEWGDIVGGIGSYPVLANPNYHQSTDFIETMNFKQILETAKVTAATLVHLASSPSRLTGLKIGKSPKGTEISWTPSPESGIKSYVVAYGPASDPMRTRVTAIEPRLSLPALPAGTHIAVRAINARGLEGWDWAREIVK